jgi:hypothetical protein
VEWVLERSFGFRIANMFWQRWLSGRAKAAIKMMMRGVPQPPGTLGDLGGPPKLSRENWELQNTLHRLPTSKIERDYGPVEQVSFAQALETTAAWMRFAGFANSPTDSHLA